MKKFVFCCVAALALPGVASAASGMKPGMWEIKTQTAMPGGHAMPDMSRLPPEVQAQMASRGIQMQGGPGGGITVRSCLTPEQAARDTPPAMDKRCRATSIQRSGNTVNWSMVCTQEDGSTVNGKGSMTMSSPESYSGTSTVTMNGPEGRTMTASSSMQGRWVGPCQ